MDSSTLVLGLVFGSLGIGYLIYGRRQRAPVPFAAGIGLLGVTYLFESVITVVIVGLVLAALPFVIKL